jgi:hypothetical protein
MMEKQEVKIPPHLWADVLLLRCPRQGIKVLVVKSFSFLNEGKQ